MKLRYLFALSAAAVVPAGALAADPQVDLRTNLGTIRLELYPAKAPKTVENFLQYVKDGHYNGTVFHRVIDGFMIQGGDPAGTGMGGPGYQFEDEFLPDAPALDRPGLVAMANAGPNTNGSQFFITVAPAPWLTGKHTVFGEVMEGYEVVEAISKVPTGPQDRPVTPVTLEQVKLHQE
jgi:cyclophilin family peptidyl-prolyl cis-trans isomerase